MFLCVGLGNPGERYKRTRHNLGFRVVDCFAKHRHVRLRKGPGPYRMVQMEIGSTPVILAEPQTYMNRSGIAVFDLVARYAVSLSRVVVVCDDLNLPLGRLRIRKSGSDGGHNGLASVIRYLGSEAFPRLRMGIGMPRVEEYSDACGGIVRYVLSPFLSEEVAIVEEMVEKSASALVEIIENGMENAMSLYNR